MFTECNPVLYYALTPVHVGIGRAPGTVDLPIVRDLYGLPYLPGSSLKGTIKSSCIRLSASGGIDREECFAAYGRDVGEREPESVSAVVVTDAPLILYPARVESYTSGGDAWLGYITSPLQLHRAADLLEACPHTRSPDLANQLRDAAKELEQARGDNGETIIVNNTAVPQDSYTQLGGHALWVLRKALRTLGSLPALLSGKVLLLEDNYMRQAVEAGIIRLTRVALDYEKKTVREGHLWSEEYVAEGAVFMGGFFYRETPHVGARKAVDLNLKVLEKSGRLIIVGGKETVGKGLIKTAVWTCGSCYPEG